MFKTIFIFIALSASILTASAQDSVKVESKSSNSLRKGMFAVQIGVGQNFTLTSFQDFTMAIKYHFSKKSAIRLSGSTDFHDNSGIRNYYDFENPENSGWYSLYNGVSTYSAQLQYIYYLKPNSLINFYTGIGPRGTFSDENHIGEGYESGFARFYKKFYGFGGTISLGFEWFPIQNFSLTAEYYAYMIWGTYHEENELYDFNNILTNKRTEDLKTKDFYWKNAFLGVTLYFSL